MAPSNIDQGDDIVEREIFDQLLEMDDDDDREFSKSLVDNYRSQFVETFTILQEALKAGDLRELYLKGHYLKGSSAALGLRKIRKTCEHIQNAGEKLGADREPLSEQEALKRCEVLLVQLKAQNDEADLWLKNYFASPSH